MNVAMVFHERCHQMLSFYPIKQKRIEAYKGIRGIEAFRFAYSCYWKRKKKKRKENQKKRHDDVICSRKEEHVKILGTNLFGFFAASCFGINWKMFTVLAVFSLLYILFLVFFIIYIVYDMVLYQHQKS